MNTFNWLLIGHLVGDWLLQNHWMAQKKRESLVTRAGLVHFLIYSGMIVSAFWFSAGAGREPAFYLYLGLLIFFSHWLIDSTNVVDWWMRAYGQSNIALVRTMVDQALHILILAFLALV